MNGPARPQRALVTGASRGIGAAIAVRLAQDGCEVAVHYARSESGAKEIAAACSRLGVRALTVKADLTSAQQVEHMRRELERLDFLPDILVNNAGAASYGLVADLEESEWERVASLNLKGVYLCSRAFMTHMMWQRSGRIVNISSVWGIVGAAGEAAYSAAKGGVNAFTLALAKELAPFGVTVNAVAPGAVDTGMTAQLDMGEREELRREIPAGRLARPEEIAAVVRFLAHPAASYITGQIVSVSGGWMC